MNAVDKLVATADTAEMTLVTVSASRRVFGTGASLRSAIARLCALGHAARARQGVLAMPEHLLDDAGLNEQSVRVAVARRTAPRSAFLA